jgi:hypothetical protein
MDSIPWWHQEIANIVYMFEKEKEELLQMNGKRNLINSK